MLKFAQIIIRIDFILRAINTTLNVTLATDINRF